MNVAGGYSPGDDLSNWGPAARGHASGYPYGQLDTTTYTYSPWEGFWSGFSYIDTRWMHWTSMNGNPDAQTSFDVQPTADGDSTCM